MSFQHNASHRNTCTSTNSYVNDISVYKQIKHPLTYFWDSKC
jgi:hypothetical protein